ncbi:MAG: hypothetical protein R3270_01090 [Gammaproteobacteria bacterium]|nr:hypothetical protein [Gammaproteobacteria bacterium]
MAIKDYPEILDARSADTYRVTESLFQDFSSINELLDKEDTGWVRRALVRAGFAFIESEIEFISAFIRSNEGFSHRLSEEETYALRGLTIEVARNGAVKTRKLRTPFENRLKLALKSLAKVTKLRSDTSVFFGGSGYESLCDALKVRDCVTHPHKQSDIEVSERNIEDIRVGCIWLTFCVEFCLTCELMILQGELERLEEKFSEQVERDTADEQLDKKMEKHIARLFQKSRLAGYDPQKICDELILHLPKAKNGESD